MTSITKIKFLALFAILWTGAAPAWCAFSGASFLKIGVGARALGLSSAYTAVADDVTALYWNPAGLASLHKRELSAMHAELFAQSRYNFLGYAHPTRVGTFAFGAAYLNQGTLEGRGEDRRATSDFSASDLALTFAGSRRLTPEWSLGASVKVIRSGIAGESAGGLAFDLGADWKLPGGKLRAGTAIQNAGPKMKFLEQGYHLPLTFALGASFEAAKGLLFSADARQRVYEGDFSLAAGAEFSPVSMLTLRAGYLAAAAKTTQAGSGRIADFAGLGMGLGFKLGSVAVDYAFSPAGELGQTQRLSLGVRF
ncbi:MAG: hypothetical protein A2901_06350 [Elusimicrobia bacterium RIFCSPLOWO2_01_FULL_54_10]|nr:MAG: hypothetical protein A2901_06350 [Elusimicrobia bacterium RIFCSPLOWO2_01_FULL_54_10]